MIERIWAVDVEGNGGSPPEIVEVAIVELKDLELTGRSFSWRVKPIEPIKPAVTRIHGITNEDVASAPSIEDIEDGVRTWIDDLPIVGHNVKVEVDALTRAFPEWSPVAAYDTLALARSLHPELESHALGKLGGHFNLIGRAADISGGSDHEAGYDAVLCALLLKALLESIPPTQRFSALQSCLYRPPVSQGDLF
ncbi:MULTISPECIES: 3'-5' exonuclease [Hyphomonas]|uniref:3'-5' exonuclease n=1 Tax=Hyphomonas TaxID=85 RepID=UPI002355070C|nr:MULTISPECIES: 3'-5' exonuclease [Hyphomonas]